MFRERDAGFFRMGRHYSGRERSPSSHEPFPWLYSHYGMEDGVHGSGDTRIESCMNFSFTTSNKALAASIAESCVVSILTSGFSGAS